MLKKKLLLTAAFLLLPIPARALLQQLRRGAQRDGRTTGGTKTDTSDKSYR